MARSSASGLTTPSRACRASAPRWSRALQKYGMYLADGGTIALAAMSDQHSTAKWTNLLGSHDLLAIQVTDFDMIAHGAPIPLTDYCVRNP